MPEAQTLHILNYPHLTLRHRSKPLRRVDAELRGIIRRMFELMYEARGIGLAANQVGLPYRFFVSNLTADPDQREAERVYINPVISHPKGSDEAEEGCLSLPGIYQNVRRPARIRLNAFNLAGQEINCELEGLEARVVQHETDHLDGVLFIDKISESARTDVKDQLEEMQLEFASLQRQGTIPDDDAIRRYLADMESLRT